MKNRTTGREITVPIPGEPFKAFVPDALPPNPPLRIENELRDKLDEALLALGRLDSVTTLLPDTGIFLYMYIRKEALLSSQIEGTQSSLSDLLLFENAATPGVPLDDVREVSHYVAALQHGLERIKGGFPLSLRLIREIHEILLKEGHGKEKTPGEFRTSQNWIGGSRPGNAAYVPPPPEKVMECMGALEKFLHDDPVKTPPLIKVALAHTQFESIHPFLDGNGRAGRLLLTLLLCTEGILSEPSLYLSLYFKTHRSAYYELLQNVRTTGDWESWLEFFATGVKETAESAVQTVKLLTKMFHDDRQIIGGLGKPSGSALRVHQTLTQNPVRSIPEIAKETKLTIPTVSSSLHHLQDLGIVNEITGKQRNRLYCYKQYFQIMSEGTEPIK